MVERRPDRVLGPGHDQFWQGCDRQELHLPRCDRCATFAWPITPVCTACSHDGFTWERLSGRATLVSWCRFERDYYQGQFPIPWDCILVELAEGPLFISNPMGLSLDDMRLGLPVQIAFLPCVDGAGPFMLPVFEAVVTGDAMPSHFPRS